MQKILEFTGCKTAMRVDAINAIDIAPDDSKKVRIFIPGVDGNGYNIRHNSEEEALKTFESIVKLMKEEV